MGWFGAAAAAMLLIMVAVLGSVADLRGRRHPNEAKDHPGRVRLPRFVAFIALVVIGCGIVGAYSTIAHPVPDEVLPTRMGALAMVAIGACLLWIYRNWFIEVHPNRIVFRRFGRCTQTIWYSQIREYRIEDGNGSRSLMIKSVDGTVFHLNISVFDAEALVQYLARLEEERRLRAEYEEQQRGAWGSQPGDALQTSQNSGKPEAVSQKPVFIEGRVPPGSPESPGSPGSPESPEHAADGDTGPFYSS
ncbi:hypothetical protein VR010_00295 [Actinomycetaceae bacterium L2_0104]